MRSQFALLALTLVACTQTNIVTRRWIGPVTPETGSSACRPSRGIAQITGTDILFAPDEGTWVLRGTIRDNGQVSAERTRLGADKAPFQTTFEGTRTADAITGRYVTPRCTYTVALKR